jgi:pyruvate,water dikinase
MMPGLERKRVLLSIRPRSELIDVGNKALNTRLMMEMGLRVPKSWALPFWLGELYREDRERADLTLEEGLGVLMDDERLFAVRSSAEGEDEKKRSFAGQFASVMNVPGRGLADAVRKVWSSLDRDGLEGYAAAPRRIGVLIQHMIVPSVSGVSFSCDPLSGRRVAVVEAVEGEGGRLVQEGVTPWRYEITPGLAVLKGGQELDRRVLDEVARTTFRLRERVGGELDLEWVHDGRRLHWVQLRSLTGLTQLDRYSNAFSQEFLPGMIKPLVWSVNVPINARAWTRLLGELTGRKDLSPDRLAKSFYYRAYFNMGEFAKVWEAMGLPDDLLESMVLQGGGMQMRPSPRLMASMWRLLPFMWSRRRWFQEVDGAIDMLRSDFLRRSSEDLKALDDMELIGRAEGLMETAEVSAYYTVLCIMSSSMASRMWRKYLERRGLDWQEMSLRTDGDGGYPETRLLELWKLQRSQGREAPGMGFQEAFERFMRDYGHYSESGNDLSVPPWGERPELVLDILDKMEGRERREAAPAKGPLVSGLQRQEARFRSYRERMGSTYTKHYSMFRTYFLEAGDRMVERGVLKDREQVFLLHLQELKRALAEPEGDWCRLAQEREEEMRGLADIALPPIIFGDVPPPVPQEALKVLTGTPSSGGYYRGRARMVRALADMRRMERGEVLVIPYSDVGWTPFFHLAGAVVSEAGGILSHSSIIAREYGVPAVVSVAGAMRLQDGMVLEIDGYTGKVTVVEGSSL